jgi:fibronectin-binding autotransporter adhesin
MTPWFKRNRPATAAPSRPTAQTTAPTPLMMALEPRIMFDAALAATAMDAVSAETAAPLPDAVERPAEPPASASTGMQPAAIGETRSRQEIIFVDTSVTNYQSLLSGINADAEVVLITAEQNGLQVIADTLAGRSEVDAIHILSHGDTGKVQLGSDWIDASDVTANAGLLAGIGDSLSADGDILLYGCHVGSDGAGVDFIQSLASATGADTAASSDATGANDKGGDWVLEATQGSIETASLNMGSYSALLAAFSDNFSTNPGTTANSFDRTLGGVSYTYTFTANGDGGAAGGGLAFGNFGSGGSAAMTLLSSAFNTGTTERVTITRTDLADFTFTSIYIDNPALNESVTVGGYLNNVLVGSTQVFTTGTTTLNFGGIQVDEVRITSTDFYGLAIDDFAGDTNPPNAAPVISNLNTDSVAWAGVAASVTLDNGGNASLTDTELGALNGSLGNWNGASLTVQRSTAIAADNFGFNTSGALFSVSGTSASGNLQSGGLTFASYTNTGGVLTVSFTNSGVTPTTALVNDVARHISYQNDTPAGDATIRFTLHDGTVAGTVANVTVTSDSIYVTNTTDTGTINVANGVSFSEAVAIAAADATGSQTIVFDSSLAATALTVNSVSLNESLTFDMDAASGMSLTTGTITLGAATTQTFTNGTSDTASITGAITGSGALTKAGAGTLSLSGSNNYSGATTVSVGTLTASGGSAIGDSSSVSVASGAIVSLSSSESTGNLSGAGTINLGSNTLASTITADTTFSGDINGTGGLTLSQSGAATYALTLSGANTYTGNTIAMNFGRLNLNGDASVSSSSQLRANGNSIITLLSDQTVGSLFSNNAGASIQLGSFTLSAGGDNTTTTVAGVISGSGNLVKQGSGTLTLAGTNTYTGTTTVSAGTLSVASDSNLGSNSLTLASGSTLDISGATNIDNAIALSGDATVSTSADATLSGAVSGAHTLTKAGASSLTLSNSNTYAGTTVSAGSLSVASDPNLGSGAVTLASGSTLAITGASNIDNAITLTGNATVSNSANATLSGVISGANTLTKSGASTLTLSNTNTYASTTVSAGTLSVASDANLGSGTVTLASGGTLGITGATNIDNAIALTGNATVSTSANATLSGVISGGFNLAKTGASALTLSNTNTYGGTTTVSAGTLSVASDSNLGSGGLTLAAGTTLAVTGATTIDNALTLSGAATVNTTADATLSGNIGGAGSLAKTGANTLTLSGTNSYAGTTTVSAGTLSIASDGNLGSSTVTLATGTTLAVTGATTIDNAMALSGNATVQAANAVTLSGAISGAGGLTKTGAGTVTLSGPNGFTGNVAVSAGGLTLSNGAAINNNSAVTMSSGTTLTLSSSETIGSLAGAGSVALGANTLTAGGDNTSTSYSGNISGTGGGITKTGAGTFTLSGTNSHTGATTISAGTIDAQNGDAIGNASAVSVASGAFLVLSAAETIGSLAGAGTATLGANTLTTGGNNTSTTFSGAITGSNGMVKTGSGTLTLSNTGNESTLSGGMTISAGTVSISDDDQMAAGTLTLNGGTLSLDGPTVFDNNIDLAASSTINSGGNAIASGVISGAGDLTKTGSLSLQLTNSNTYTGATFVNAGYLLANNANSLGTTAGATSVASGATLYLSGSFTLAEALNLTGTGMLGNGAIYAPSGNSTVTGLVTLSGNTTLKLDGDLTFSGGITDGASSYSLSKEDAGTLTLSGTASYDGSTTISSGGLSLGSDSHLGSGALTLAAGTTLAVTGATTIDNAVTLSSGTATVNTSANTTLSGNIAGAGGLTKTGASTLTLSGTDSYSGATNVNAGALLVNGALTATSNTAVASGATLGGTGSIGSNVTVNSGGTLSPGNSAGTLTVNGNLIMAAGSTLAVEIDGATAGTGYDQVIVNGTVDVSGATLSATHGYVAGSGDTYNIIVNDAADAVTGSFSGISEGATVTAGGNSTVLTTSYIGATGNDVTLTAPVFPVVTGVSSSTPNGSYKIGDTLSVSVTFDMAVFVSGGTPTLLLETGSVDRTLNYVSGSGSTTLVFDYTVQAGDLSTDLDYASTGALVLNGATIQDALNLNANLTLASPGAANSLGANKALVIDGVVPTAGIVVADTALAAGETSTVTITFSEAVSGLAVGDFTVANGVLSGLGTGDGGVTWTATLTPTAATTDTSNLITLDNTGYIDAAGNTGTATTDSNNYAIDTARPTAGIVVADTALAAGETSTVTITFSEAVSGLAIGDFTVANGALSALSTGDGGITWTATLTPTASTTDTSNLITLDNTGYIDPAGNTGTATTDSNNYAIDTARPTAGIVVADTALAAGETSTVTITFSEAVSGLAIGDFTVANGALSGLSTGDGGVTWTATLTPTASTTDTSNLITLDNTGYIDAAGNTGTATTDSNNYAIDTARPTAGIVVADTALAAGETSTVTITFSEAVSGLAIGDFTVANGALSGISTADGGITWTATFTPTASTTDASNLITLANTGVTDAAGNTGTGTTDSNNYSIDTLRPTASIVVADTALAAGETSTVTITFSEAVSGLAIGDFTVANGALSGLTTGDGGITWTATLTPTASTTDSSNLITLANTGVTDAAGNTGTGTTDSNNVAIDTLRPTASIVVADTALAAGETSLVTITFNEAVLGLAADDFTVANGALSGLSTGDGGITWTATFTPSTSTTDTSNLITLANTGVADAAGNTGTATTDSNNYSIDTLRPTASIVVADTALAAGETSLVTITFNEAVTGLTTADFAVPNGALSGLTTGDNITWTATFTPSTSTTDTSNLITLDNTGVADAAGNTGTGSTDSNNVAIDTLRPTANIVVADTSLAAGETSLVTITFSEAVTGLTTGDFTVANGALSSLSTGDGGITWTATFTPSTSTTDTTNLITLDNTGVQDAAGNTGTGTTDSNNVAIDTAVPTVTSVAVPADATYLAGQNLDFSLNLSEAVTVDTSGGTPRISLTLDTGGTVYASYLSGSGSSTLVFRATVTAGQVDGNGIGVASTLELNGGTLRDAAGNNTLTTLISVGPTAGVQIDAAPPTVTAVSLPANGHYNAGDVLSFTVTASETITVAGAPRLALDMGGNTGYASYVSGSGSNALLFQYTVQAGDNDADGLAPSGLQANGSTLRDAAGNDMALALNGVGATAGVQVDTTDPLASAIVRADPTPTAAGSVRFTVSFSEAVSGLDLADFALSTTGNAGGTLASVTQLDAQTYSVLVTGLQGAGDLTLNLNNSGTGVTDVAGNSLATGLTGASYELRPPVVVAPPAPPPTPEPPAPPPSIAPAPATPPVTLAPTEPISPIATPTLTAGSPASVLVVATNTGPSGNDVFAAPTISAPPPASTPARSFIEVGAASGAGLQSTPEIGSFSAQAGQPVSVSLPSATFTHSERNVQVSVEVRLADGRPLPAWLKFDPVTGTLSGEPPRGLNQKLSIEVVARDSKGNRATTHLSIEIKSAPSRSEVPLNKPRPESGVMLDPLLDPLLPGKDLAAALDQKPAPETGRASLAAQFERYGTAARQAERDALLEHARAALSES